MRDPTFVPPPIEERAVETSDVTRDERGFTVMLRNTLFRVVLGLARGDADQVLATIAPEDADGNAWTRERLLAARAAFDEDHPEGLRTDPSARVPSLLRVVTQTATHWQLQRILPDASGDDDWYVEARVDLARSRDAGEPVVVLERIAR